MTEIQSNVSYVYNCFTGHVEISVLGENGVEVNRVTLKVEGAKRITVKEELNEQEQTCIETRVYVTRGCE